MPEKLIEWGVAVRARDGEGQSGDYSLVFPAPDRILVAAIDGLGHGPEAVLASRTAAAALESTADRPLPDLFTACHEALRSTRGVVMSMAAFHRFERSMSWLGVGNVEGRLLRGGRSPAEQAEDVLLLRGGVLGDNLPATLEPAILPVARGDVLVLATDGVGREFTRELRLGRSAHQLADEVLSRHAKRTDDALVVVAKYRGGVLWPA